MTEAPTETLAQSAPAELKPSRFQLKIQRLQAESRAKHSGESKYLTESKPIIYTTQLEKTTVELLIKVKRDGVLDMIEPLRNAVQYLDKVVTGESSDSDRLKAAMTLAWLAAQTLRAEIKLDANSVKKAAAGKSVAIAAARKAKHEAKKATAVIDLAKARKKIDRQLRRSQQAQEDAAEIQRLEQAIKDASGSFSKLQAKQALSKFKNDKKGRK